MKSITSQVTAIEPHIVYPSLIDPMQYCNMGCVLTLCNVNTLYFNIYVKKRFWRIELEVDAEVHSWTRQPVPCRYKIFRSTYPSAAHAFLAGESARVEHNNVEMTTKTITTVDKYVTAITVV